MTLRPAGVVLALLWAASGARAASTETSNGCMGTQDDPCVRSGTCEIQGAQWGQDVTIDRSDIFDTQGWPGLCDMVHVGLVQGDCEPGGAQTDVTVHLSATSFAWIPQLTGPLVCAGDVQPPAIPIPASKRIGAVLLALLLVTAGCRTARRSQGRSRAGSAGSRSRARA